ncbi:MAG: OmpA family protein [Melioribacteraceae bacterium]
MGKKSDIVKFFYAVLFILIGTISTYAQTSGNSFKDFGFKGGFQINGVLPTTEFESDNGLSLSSYLLRGFFRFELSNDWQAELGAGYGKLSGDGGKYYLPSSEYESSIIPIEARILYTPFDLEGWNPYFYAGIGMMNYDVTKKPVAVSPDAVSNNGWTGIIPVGIGTEIKLSDEIALDVSLGYNYSLTENLNFYKIPSTTNDGYINLGLGLSFSNESLNTDHDHDGLTKREELALGTDPMNADTDGDGLKDGEEVNKYMTNPLKVDTDGDGLGDGDEVMKYKTNPTKVDTDGDGLADGDEVLKYKTDPLKTDTDGDGLKDGEEVNMFKTSPLKVDTDSDELGDGDEVLKHKTDPLKADTDGGTVFDGVEVKRGTNPLDPKDDVPPTEVEKELTFDFVHFGFDKSALNKASKKILDNAVEVLSKYPDAKIKLGGHTDSIGSENYNQKLSVKRANVVRDYLVKKGISDSQIVAEGFGELKPVAPNKTAKDRAQNRRTEIGAKYMEKL